MTKKDEAEGFNSPRLLKRKIKMQEINEEEIIEIFYPLDFALGDHFLGGNEEKEKFYESYKAGFLRGRQARNLKMLNILKELCEDLKTMEYTSIGKDSKFHKRIMEILDVKN